MKTKRLFIKEMTEADYIDFSEIVIDFKNSKYSMYNPPLPQDDYEMEDLFYFYLDCIMAYGIYLNNEMIGVVTVISDNNEFEIGYMFKNKYQRKGYAYEGTKAVIDLLIDNYGKYNVKIIAGTAIKNEPSIKLLNKLGFKCESIEEVSFIENVTMIGCNYVLEY